MLELLRDLNRERGLTMILVTHDLQIAQQADRVVRLAEGRIEEWAPGLRWRESSRSSPGERGRGGSFDAPVANAKGGREPPSPMSLKVYIGGKLYDKADAKISVYDHGLLYGDGVFEGIRSYSGRVFRLADHVDRLVRLGPVDPPPRSRSPRRRCPRPSSTPLAVNALATPTSA